ncbi:MAG: encapsulin-associated ferritin-like protein [Phycisphaerae bacterium]
MPLEFHEPRELLPEEIIDQHRACQSLIEELEAVMWYHQRAAVTQDQQLKAVLIHNRDEEIEHAMMNLEWLRRNFAAFDEQMRTYLFTELPITEVEEAAEEGGDSPDAGESGPDASGDPEGDLKIGSRRKKN